MTEGSQERRRGLLQDILMEYDPEGLMSHEQLSELISNAVAGFRRLDAGLGRETDGDVALQGAKARGRHAADEAESRADAAQDTMKAYVPDEEVKGSPLAERLLKMAQDGEATAYSWDDPGDMPEVNREIVILSGAISCLENRLLQLVVRLGPVMTKRVGELRADLSDQLVALNKPPVLSPVGRQLLELQKQVGELERLCTLTEYAVGVHQ